MEIEQIYVSTYNELYNNINNHSNIKKKIIKFKDPEKKKVNNEFTSCINKFYIEKDYCTSLLKNIVNIFGHLDSDLKTINKGVLPGNSIGYLVFKGGNAIKYWLIKSQLNKLNKLASNVLKLNLKDNDGNIFHEEGAIHNYSDFDFGLYIDYDKSLSTKDDYKIFLINTFKKSINLRDKLYLDVLTTDKKNFSNDIKQVLKNLDLHCEINKFLLKLIKNLDTLSFNNIIIKPDIVEDIFITKDLIDDNKNIIYAKKIDNCMNVSLNNTIKNISAEFDLFRIKLNFDVKSTIIDQKFKSEIFDLSILTSEDSTLKEFIENIDKSVNFIKINDVTLRSYNVEYLISDILRIFFIQNKFPWDDIKYAKRLIRLSLLYASLIQEEGLDSDDLKILLFNIINFTYIVDNNTLFEQLNNEQKKIVLYEIINFNKIMINIDLHEEINDILNDINIKDMSRFTSMINDKPTLFISVITILLMKKIYIDGDKEWCLNIYLPENAPKFFDINLARLELIRFCKTLVYYCISGINILTDFFEKYKYTWIAKSLDKSRIKVIVSIDDHKGGTTTLIPNIYRKQFIYNQLQKSYLPKINNLSNISTILMKINKNITNYLSDMSSMFMNNTSQFTITISKNNKEINYIPRILKSEKNIEDMHNILCKLLSIDDEIIYDEKYEKFYDTF